MIGGNKKLDYIAKSNKLIQSKYKLNALELKFTYIFMEIIQSSIQNVYKKNYKDTYDSSYFEDEDNNVIESENSNLSMPTNHNMLSIINNIKLNKNISTNKKCEIKRIQYNNGSIWNIKVKYSLNDFYSDFKEISNMARLSKKDFREVIEGVREKGVYIFNEEDNKFKLTQWFSIEGELSNFYNEIELEVDKDIAEYIITKGYYTKLAMETISLLKSVYALRLYELITQWDNSSKSPEYEVEYLKEILGVADNPGYKIVTNFRRNILDKAIEEINEYSIIKYSIEEIKKGRRIIGYRFVKVSTESSIGIKEEEDKIIKYSRDICNIISLKISKSVMKEIYKDFELEGIDLINKHKDILINAEKETITYMSNLKSKSHKSINAYIYPYFKRRILKRIPATELGVQEVQEVQEKFSEAVNDENKIEPIYDDKLTGNNNSVDSEVAVGKDDNIPEENNNNDLDPQNINSDSDLLKNLAKQFSKGLSEVSYNTWIKPCELYRGTKKDDKDKLVIIVPNTFTEEIIRKRYKEIFENVSKECDLKGISLKIRGEE